MAERSDDLRKLGFSGDISCGTHGRGEKSVQGFDGKARRKETTGKTKA
jgi:hypothetical protein